MQVESIFPLRRRFAVPILSSGLLFAALAGCHRPPSPDVMATVNGKEILRSEVEKYYKANLGDNPQVPSPEQANIVRLSVLRNLIDVEIIQQRAAKLNLTATDEDVNAKLTEMKTPYTQEQFDKQLQQRGITLDDLKREIRQNLTQNKLLNKEIESKINITDANITSYYKDHKAEFNLIEPQYHLAQVVASAEPVAQPGGLQAKAPSEADAKKKIQALYSRLRSGEDFGAVAIQFSDNANNASNGGDMGFIYESGLRSSFDPDTYNAISKLKAGEITDILPMYDSAGPGRHIGAYAVYKLIAREPAGQRELNDPRVQQAIHQLLHENHAQLLKNAYFEMLHDQAKIRNYFAEQILKEGAQ